MLKLGRTLIDTRTLDEGIARLAAEVDRDQAGRPALLVGILKGSVFFLCDLAKRLNAISGIEIPLNAITRRLPSFPLAALTDDRSLALFLETLDWFVSEVRATPETARPPA